MNIKMVKTIGVLVTVLGLGANLITEWVADKKMEDSIDKKVDEALAKRDES